VNDIGFINYLIDKLVKDYPVDPQWIYATGMSNGGMMTHHLGIALSNRFAAISPVVATFFGDEPKPQYPVFAVMLNGMLDQHVPNQGGPAGGRFQSAWDGAPTRPALEQAAFWVSVDGCANMLDQDDHGPYSVAVSLSGRQGHRNLPGQGYGHAWPGGQRGDRRGDKPSSSLNATDVIWEFFKAHTK